MRVAELIHELERCNADAEVKVGMFYGPGSPSVQVYTLERVGEFDPRNSDGRYAGPHIVWLAGHDPRRTANLKPPSATTKEAIHALRRAADDTCQVDGCMFVTGHDGRHWCTARGYFESEEHE